MYRDIAAGRTGMLNMVIPRYFMAGGRRRLSAMPTAMDVASGISEERLVLATEQGRSALLGMALNFPMPQLRDALPGLDLGDEFREETQSDVPTLLLSGTLDGRTYPEEQMEAVAGLDNLSRVTVENAGHNLFMVTPEVKDAIEAFLRGGSAGEDCGGPAGFRFTDSAGLNLGELHAQLEVRFLHSLIVSRRSASGPIPALKLFSIERQLSGNELLSANVANWVVSCQSRFGE